MKPASADERFMRSALSEARKGIGLTSPNPAVGAVMVIDNRIIARGHHRGAGCPHAEVECLHRYGRLVPAKATLYVTLEPCSTVGRTPACTDQIIRSGVKTVVIGAIDPNPQHAGRGIELLRNAGIEVQTGVLADECAALNEAFNKWIVARIPFVIAKCAMTLDGRLTRPHGETRWVSSRPARRQVHELRSQVDAILVGAETIRTDNPHLTVRGRRSKRQPIRVVLTRSGNLPEAARIFTDRFAAKTVVFKDKPLGAVLRELGKKEITSVLIEGGGQILSQALEQRLIDKLQVYFGPMLAGGPVLAFGGRGAGATSEAVRLERVRYEKLGDDLCAIGYPNYPEQAE
jgi:diaminohydroxyphosphoribosylaminopyrimidine deaminase/5-amino-6-(5-phosphoribosylamino)uracil reductase